MTTSAERLAAQVEILKLHIKKDICGQSTSCENCYIGIAMQHDGMAVDKVCDMHGVGAVEAILQIRRSITPTMERSRVLAQCREPLCHVKRKTPSTLRRVCVSTSNHSLIYPTRFMTRQDMKRQGHRTSALTLEPVLTILRQFRVSVGSAGQA